MFDVLNERLISEGKDPIAFDHDCREGICGTCSMYINGRPHGPWHATYYLPVAHACILKMAIPLWWNHGAPMHFPVIKDLVVDRSAFDRIIQAGGFISVNTGNAVDANAIPIEKDKADASFALRPVSVAAPVWLPVKTVRPCCCFRQKFLTWPCCHRVTRKQNTRTEYGSANG